jgi:hypothetical protein
LKQLSVNVTRKKLNIGINIVFQDQRIIVGSLR